MQDLRPGEWATVATMHHSHRIVRLSMACISAYFGTVSHPGELGYPFTVLGKAIVKSKPTQWFDGREMEMVHKMFRREFGLMPGLLRDVTDAERATIIAHHFNGLAVTLHGHHHSEDADLWPLVLNRVDASAATAVASMEAQ